MANPIVVHLHSDAIFKNWARTIGELGHGSPANPNLVALVRVFFSCHTNFDLDEREKKQQKSRSGNAVVCACALVGLTASRFWQARWGHFFVLIYSLALPACSSQSNPARQWDCICVIDLSDLHDWDERLLAE